MTRRFLQDMLTVLVVAALMLGAILA